MSESTGETFLDAAGDPAPLDVPIPTPLHPRSGAWRAYQDHLRGCSQCTNSVWRCSEGNELWSEYLRY